MSASEQTVQCFAMRRVNPFLGVLQVLESMAGRAISANGVVWDIELLTEYNDGWGTLNSNSNEQAWYRYGIWSWENGLVSRPLASQFDSSLMEEKANNLIQSVRTHLDQLPFKLEDRNELWLFDSDDQQPVALLASCIYETQRPRPEPRYWKATVGEHGVASQRRYPASNELEALVRARAGSSINKHWVVRDDDWGGYIESKGEQVDAGFFPSYLLAECWPEPGQHELVRHYLEWVAPSLLTLQDITPEQRMQMETHLNIQAVSVEHHWRLYPDVHDEEKLNAARVQCRLQKAHPK